MKLRPFFCMFGGKWRIAGLYPPPEHEDVCEVFAGGASYSLHHSDRRVLLVEKDPEIASIWSYLIKVSAAEISRLPDLEVGQTVDDLRGAPQEARSLVGFWLNSCVTAPRKSPSARMRSGIRPGCYWGSAIRERIASQVDRIRHWRVILGSYEEAPDVEATWFVDSPYERAGVHYRSGRPDFAALAAWSRTRRGLTIVCEQEGASWLPFRPHVVAKANEGMRGGKKSREAVWIRRSEDPEGVADMSSDAWGACPDCGAEVSRENASRLPGGRVVHVGCPGKRPADHPSSMKGDRDWRSSFDPSEVASVGDAPRLCGQCGIPCVLHRPGRSCEPCDGGCRLAPVPCTPPLQPGRPPRRVVGLGRRSPTNASSVTAPLPPGADDVPPGAYAGDCGGAGENHTGGKWGRQLVIMTTGRRIGEYAGPDAVRDLIGRRRDPASVGPLGPESSPPAALRPLPTVAARWPLGERTELPRYPGGNEVSLQTCASLGIGLVTPAEAERQAGDEIVEPPPIEKWCRACSFKAQPQLGPVLAFGPGKHFHPGCAERMGIDPRTAGECSLVDAFVGLLSRFIEWWASEEPEDDSTPEEDDEDDEEKAREDLNKRQLAALAEPPPLRAHNRTAAPQTLEPGREIHVFESFKGPLWSAPGARGGEALEARCGLKVSCGGRDLEWTVLALTQEQVEQAPGLVEASRDLDHRHADDPRVDLLYGDRLRVNKVKTCGICACSTTARGGGTPYPAIVAPSQILAPPRSPDQRQRIELANEDGTAHARAGSASLRARRLR